MGTKEEHKALQLSARIIKTQTGIELTTAEFWKLRIYYLDMKRERQFGEWSRIGTYELETRVRFLGDLFGIDFLDYAKRKLLGTEEFKEYCKGRVNSWRDEVNLL